MTKNLPETPTVSNLELSLPFCDTSSSNSIPPQYCISSKHAGDCFNCPLSDGCKDCQGHTFSFCLADYLEEPDRPEYCSQNGGDCSTCSLVNYGLDCQNNRVSDREVSHD